MIPIASNLQSYLLLGLALAATFMLGAFDAYETEAAAPDATEET